MRQYTKLANRKHTQTCKIGKLIFEGYFQSLLKVFFLNY